MGRIERERGKLLAGNLLETWFLLVTLLASQSETWHLLVTGDLSRQIQGKLLAGNLRGSMLAGRRLIRRQSLSKRLTA